VSLGNGSDGVCDVIVAGVGAMGAAALWHLARRGVRALGLEPHGVPHALGSSHGYSRAIRLAYFEHPDYVPLLRRAWDLWGELEEAAGRRLLYRTGCLYAGPPDSDLIRGSLASARTHGLPPEALDREGLAARFPQFRVQMKATGRLRTAAHVRLHCRVDPFDGEQCAAGVLEVAVGSQQSRAGGAGRCGYPGIVLPEFATGVRAERVDSHVSVQDVRLLDRDSTDRSQQKRQLLAFRRTPLSRHCKRPGFRFRHVANQRRVRPALQFVPLLDPIMNRPEPHIVNEDIRVEKVETGNNAVGR
jgi:hypothetical protein